MRFDYGHRQAPGRPGPLSGFDPQSLRPAARLWASVRLRAGPAGRSPPFPLRSRVCTPNHDTDSDDPLVCVGPAASARQRGAAAGSVSAAFCARRGFCGSRSGARGPAAAAAGDGPANPDARMSARLPVPASRTVFKFSASQQRSRPARPQSSASCSALLGDQEIKKIFCQLNALARAWSLVFLPSLTCRVVILATLTLPCWTIGARECRETRFVRFRQG